MMIKKLNYLTIVSLLIAGFFFSSCEKETPEDTLKTTTVSDYTAILDILDLNEIDAVVEDDNLKSISNAEFDRCFEVTIHDNGSNSFWPRSWTFVYGDNQCIDYFGNTKLGSVHVTLSDFWKNEGSTRTITFEDYSINGNAFAGTRTIVNLGLNEVQNMTFERNFENASYSKGDTSTMTWESSKEVEMITGSDTFIASDDEYLVSGGAEGVNFDGNPFTINIVDPLHYKMCGRFPVSGSISIDIEGSSTIYIDYGEGECDAIAEMEVDGVISEITLGITQ